MPSADCFVLRAEKKRNKSNPQDHELKRNVIFLHDVFSVNDVTTNGHLSFTSFYSAAWSTD